MNAEVRILCNCGTILVELSASSPKFYLNTPIVELSQNFEDALWSDARDPEISYLICPICDLKHEISETDG